MGAATQTKSGINENEDNPLLAHDHEFSKYKHYKHTNKKYKKKYTKKSRKCNGKDKFQSIMASSQSNSPYHSPYLEHPSPPTTSITPTLLHHPPSCPSLHLPQNLPHSPTDAKEQLKSRRFIVTTGSSAPVFISNNKSKSQLEEESNTRLSSPNFYNVFNLPTNVTSPPPPTRRDFLTTPKPSSTTSILPPLPSTNNNKSKSHLGELRWLRKV